MFRSLTPLIAASILLTCPVQADEGEVRTVVESYLRDFNAVQSPERLAESFMADQVTIITSSGVTHLDGAESVAGWLRGVQENLAKQDWIRSELIEGHVCLPDENVALFSMKLARVGEESRETLGGTYTLLKTDRWRIVSVMIMDPGKLIRCG